MLTPADVIERELRVYDTGSPGRHCQGLRGGHGPAWCCCCRAFRCSSPAPPARASRSVRCWPRPGAGLGGAVAAGGVDLRGAGQHRGDRDGRGARPHGGRSATPSSAPLHRPRPPPGWAPVPSAYPPGRGLRTSAPPGHPRPLLSRNTRADRGQHGYEVAVAAPSRYYARVFTLVTAAVLAYLLLRILAPFAVPLMWASVLAFMLYPAAPAAEREGEAAGVVGGAAHLQRLRGGDRPAGALLHHLRAPGQRAAGALPGRGARPQAAGAAAHPPAGAGAGGAAAAGEFTSLSSEEILSSATEAAQGAIQQVAALGSTVVVGTVAVVTQFALTLFLLFFFLRDGARMLERGIRLIPMAPAPKKTWPAPWAASRARWCWARW